MDQRWLISRRAALGSLGVAALSPLFRGSRAAAQAVLPKRLVVMHVPEGLAFANAPAPTATSMGRMLAPLDEFRAKTLVLDNLAIPSRTSGPGESSGHHRAVGHMMTGTEMASASAGGGTSVDQRVAQALVAGSRRRASVNLSNQIRYGDMNSKPFWSAANAVVPTIADPWDAYTRVLAGVTPTSGGPAPAPPPTTDLRRSALNYAREEIVALRGRLAASDRQRLDSYHDSLSDIERRLGALGSSPAPAPGAAAAACALPAEAARFDRAAQEKFPDVGRIHMDVIVAALQCDVTRVATLQWGNSNDQCDYRFLGINTVGHDLAHNNRDVDPDGEKKVRVYHWYAQQIAYFLRKLEAVREGPDGATMLDNTLVLVATEFGHAGNHNADNLRWLLIGNVGSYFRTGRVVRFAGDAVARSVNNLHVSLCNAFGIATHTFGNPSFCRGALPDLR